MDGSAPSQTPPRGVGFTAGNGHIMTLLHALTDIDSKIDIAERADNTSTMVRVEDLRAWKEAIEEHRKWFVTNRDDDSVDLALVTFDGNDDRQHVEIGKTEHVRIDALVDDAEDYSPTHSMSRYRSCDQ